MPRNNSETFKNLLNLLSNKAFLRIMIFSIFSESSFVKMWSLICDVKSCTRKPFYVHRNKTNLLPTRSETMMEISRKQKILSKIRCCKHILLFSRHVTLLVDRGVSWQEASKRYEQMTGSSDGFYCSKREHKGRRLYVLAAQKEHATHLFTIIRYAFLIFSFPHIKFNQIT